MKRDTIDNAIKRGVGGLDGPAQDEEADEINGQTLAKGGGFSLHAGVSAKSHQRDKVERLCRYIARPAVSTHRLERLPDGKLSYELKTPYKREFCLRSS